MVAFNACPRSMTVSKAFELAGITAQTPDPSDGRFFKTNGELNGRVAENARGVFSGVGKRETFTPEQRRDRARNGMRHMSKLFNACGLTSVHNAGTDSEHILAYEDGSLDGPSRRVQRIAAWRAPEAGALPPRLDDPSKGLEFPLSQDPP